MATETSSETWRSRRRINFFKKMIVLRVETNVLQSCNPSTRLVPGQRVSSLTSHSYVSENRRISDGSHTSQTSTISSTSSMDMLSDLLSSFAERQPSPSSKGLPRLTDLSAISASRQSVVKTRRDILSMDSVDRLHTRLNEVVKILD